LQEIKNKNGSTIGYKWKMLPKEMDITYNDTGYTDIQMHVIPPKQKFEEFFNYFSREHGILKTEKEKYKKWYNGDLAEKIDPLRFEVQIMPEQMLLLKTIEEPYYQTRKIIQDCLGKIGNIANPKLEFSKAGESNLEEHIKSAIQRNGKNWDDKIVEFFKNPKGKNDYKNPNYIGDKFSNPEYKEIFSNLRSESEHELQNEIETEKLESRKFKEHTKREFLLKTLVRMYLKSIQISKEVFKNAPSVLPTQEIKPNRPDLECTNYEMQQIAKKMYDTKPSWLEIKGSITKFRPNEPELYKLTNKGQVYEHFSKKIAEIEENIKNRSEIEKAICAANNHYLKIV